MMDSSFGAFGESSFSQPKSDRRHGDGKAKKTKTEKICELQGDLKIAKEENRRLKKEIQRMKSSSSRGSSSFSEDVSLSSEGGAAGNEKLKEALRALKRVTVKQEMSLSSLRSKARERRHEIEQKNSKIMELKNELKILRDVHEKTLHMETGDVGELMAKVADLELQLATAGSKNSEQTKKLEENKESMVTLRGQLEKIRHPPQRQPSTRSVRSNGSSMSAAEDVNRLKRELARKLETIVNLEHSLQLAEDEIHDLKQKRDLHDSFPATPAPGVEDFFSYDEEDEEEFWGG